VSEIQLLRGHVYHARSETAKNSFRYPIMNVYFDVQEESRLQALFKKSFFNLLSLSSRGYLSKSRDSLNAEVRELVKTRFGYEAETVFLQTIPKMFGYVFNPVSFWYFYKGKQLDAVLCEVNNTFGEKHFYWLHEQSDLNGRWLLAKKEFHVSPFFDLSGNYKFKFAIAENKIESHILFLNADNTVRLVTWIKGELTPLQNASLAGLLLNYGWMTPLVVLRIHYQAAKLFLKSVKFFTKPAKPAKDVTLGKITDSK
jgi:DUF1365 family protein